MPSFEDILNMPASDIKPPKPLPPGTYLCLIDGIPEFAKIGEKQTDVVNFNARVMQPLDDVDHQLLAEFENGVAGKTVRIRFFITEDAKHRLLNFLKDHLDIEVTTLKQMISEAPGRQVLVTIKHRVVQDGANINVYTDVSGTAHP